MNIIAGAVAGGALTGLVCGPVHLFAYLLAALSAVHLPHGKWGACGIDYATG